MDQFKRNLSGRLLPRFARPLQRRFPADDGNRGLAYLDLLRAVEQNAPTGQALASMLEVDDAGPDVGAWLERLHAKYMRDMRGGRYRNPTPEQDAIFWSFAEHTPLLLYVLCEAADGPHEGRRLGPLGSKVVALVMADALLATDPGEPDVAFKKIFKCDEPDSMAKLFAFLG